jgi:hypothetical protein
MVATAEYFPHASSRCSIRRREKYEACERSGKQCKIFVDRFIDQAIASLMLTFTAEAIRAPGDNKAMVRITESHRALRAPMSEGRFTRVSSESIRDCLQPMAVGVANDAESKVNNVLEGLIELVDSMTHRHLFDRRRRDEGSPIRKLSVSQQQLKEDSQFSNWSAKISAR